MATCRNDILRPVFIQEMSAPETFGRPEWVMKRPRQGLTWPGTVGVADGRHD
jgi:hypothetical protein